MGLLRREERLTDFLTNEKGKAETLSSAFEKIIGRHQT